MSVLLEVRGVSKRFGAVQAIERLDFHVADGEILGIIGPNGAGKTTAINLISGVMRPDVGSITLAGDDVTGTPITLMLNWKPRAQ